MPLDLPAEIWLRIASLLPKRHLHKLAGINRMLFSLAMDEIYREVRFMDDGEDMLRTLQQLEHPDIASRVKHVYIRPTFFPEMVEPDPDPDPAFLGRVKSKMSHLGRKARLSFKPREDILPVAQRALANCKASEKLTIILKDTLPPASFDMFLKTIWSSLGSNIRRFKLEVTFAKFPLILKHGMLDMLPKLTDLHISVAPSAFLVTHKHCVSALHALELFALNLKLESLTLSGFGDVSFLLRLLRSSRRLQNLTLPVGIRPSDYTDSFISFLAQCDTTLQHLTLNLPSAAPPSEPVSSNQQYVMRALCDLELPVLQSLRILGERWRSSRFALPLSSVKLPHLVSLTLSGAYMSNEDIETTFGNPFRGNRLESLKLGVKELSPKVLNTLAAAVPRLTDLDIVFKYRYIENPLNLADGLSDFDFEQQLRDCDYSDWMIQNLRLSRVRCHTCATPRPHLRTMEIVARFLPLPVKLGIEDVCVCFDCFFRDDGLVHYVAL